MKLNWKIGAEIELLAPPGLSREDLAAAIASVYGASVKRIFLIQGEPSKVPGTPVFENLTLGFDVVDKEAQLLARCVDDLTLQSDLDRMHAPRTGWYRIVSDDSRLVRLVMRNTDPQKNLSTVLQPIADLYGTPLQQGDGGMIRVVDENGGSIAIALPLPGERERPCELITPPIDSDHEKRLDVLLEQARLLGFTIPSEGAIHLHFDGERLCEAATLANLVNLLDTHGEAIKNHFGTNPNCRRLGGWPRELIELVNTDGFASLNWEDARMRLADIELTKYCDFNLRNLVHDVPGKHTFEVRILPVWLEALPIVEAASFFIGILDWAREKHNKPKAIPNDFEELKRLLKNDIAA
jgi:hypothetical protein